MTDQDIPKTGEWCGPLWVVFDRVNECWWLSGPSGNLRLPVEIDLAPLLGKQAA